MTRAAARKLTYADYEKIPCDGHRHEILEGGEFMTPAPDPEHQQSVLEIVRRLADHADDRGLGRVFVAPTDVILSAHDIVQPDVFFIAAERTSIIGRRNIEGAPDLVVEVSSPSTAAQDRGAKRALYDRSGVREYWIVDLPARTLEIHEFGETRRIRVYREGQSFESGLFPGLVLDVGDLF
jgi:Uma2 family endonuclease